MGSIAGADAYFIIAVQMVMISLVALGVLWNARGTAVYLYLCSFVVGAMYHVAFLSGSAIGEGDSLSAKMAIAASVITSAWLKNISLGLLESPNFPLSGYLKGSVIMVIGMLSIPLLFPDPLSFSTIVGLCVVGIMARVCMLAYRIGSALNSLAAKFFVVLIGLQLLGIVVGLVSSFMTETPILVAPLPSRSLASLSTSLALVMINSALFIALVLDINIRQRELAQKDLIALEVTRSRAQERETLLADMHDGLGSQIATARMRVERGEMTQTEVVRLLRECSADLHLMVDTLREQNDSLEAALVDYKTRVERRISEQGVGLSWNVQLSGAPSMAPRRMLQVLRIIQEAINNAIHHAKATEVIVAVRYLDDHEYMIKVEDDGIGIPDNVSPGRGLSNMRRRARELGGNLDIRRRSGGKGTEVQLSFEDRPV